MEKQDPQDQDLQHQQLYDHQHLQQQLHRFLQYYQQLYDPELSQRLHSVQQQLQQDQQRLQQDQQLLQQDQQRNQRLLQQNQQLLQFNQQLLQQNQQLLQDNQLMQHFGQPFHQVPYPVYYSQGSNVYYGPGPLHGIARLAMAKVLSTSNAAERCTSQEENRSFSNDQNGDYYERRRNNEALNMYAGYLRDQTAELNRLFLQFQEIELKEKSRVQEFKQQGQNNLQNPAPGSSQDHVPNSIGQEASVC